MKPYHYHLITGLLFAYFLGRAYSEEELKIAAQAGEWQNITAALSAESDSQLQSLLRLRAAELALRAGESAAAYTWLRDFLHNAPPHGETSVEVARARALLEFIFRNSADQVEVTLLMAKDLSGESNTNARLDGVALLLGRAEDWQKRHRAEWPELASLLVQALREVRDVGNADFIFRHTLLYVRAANLHTGDYAAGAEKIRQVLSFYAPEALQVVTYRRKLSADTCRLLLCLSQQYAEMAQRANQQEDKKRYYAHAAGYLLNAANALGGQTPEFERACAELEEYQEALRLLGFQLKLPEYITPTPGVGRKMLKAMLSSQRYQAAISAISRELKKPQPPEESAELTLLYLLALSGAERDAEIATAADALQAELLSDTGLAELFQCARQLQKRQLFPEALLLYTKLIHSNRSAHPDYSGALFQAAQLALDCEQPDLAASYFERYGATLADPGARAQAILNAVLCDYRHQDFAHVRELVRRESPPAPPEPRFQLIQLGAQAALRLNQPQSALNELENVWLEEEQIPEKQKPQLLLLSGIAANENQNSAKAIFYLERFLREFPADPQILEAAEKLLELYAAASTEVQLQTLADIVAKHHATRPEALVIIEKIARLRVNSSQSAVPLDTYRALSSAPQLPEALLLQIVRSINSKAFCGLVRQQAQMTLLMIAGRLPVFNDDPLVRELYYCRLEALVISEQYQEALEAADQLLKCPGQYRFFEVKLLRASALGGFGRFESVRQECQEVIAADTTLALVRRAGLMIAESWRDEGNDSHAIATAWSIVPPGDFKQLSEADRSIVELGLRLIIECSRRLSSTIDREDAEQLLQQFIRLPE